MRKWLVPLLVISAILVVVGVAFACEEPQPPVCPADQITVTPAEWVPGTPYWGPWQNGLEIPSHDSQTQWRGGRNGHSQHRHLITPEGSWIDPVCRAPIAGCMDSTAVNYNAAAEVDDGLCEYLPQGEQCGRCSNILPNTYVTWFDRDGGCDNDWYNERQEFPNSVACGYVEPTPEVTPTPVVIVPPEPLFCTYTVTTWNQCNSGASIMAWEYNVNSSDQLHTFHGYVPYNRDCAWCAGLTGLYYREWVNDCDGTLAWTEGNWVMPAYMHSRGITPACTDGMGGPPCR